MLQTDPKRTNLLATTKAMTQLSLIPLTPKSSANFDYRGRLDRLLKFGANADTTGAAQRLSEVRIQPDLF
jgi:hypothetical protein